MLHLQIEAKLQLSAWVNATRLRFATSGQSDG